MVTSCRETRFACVPWFQASRYNTDPKKLEDNGRASLITTVPNNLHRIMNQEIFKQILKFGVEEDKIWEALGMLKK